MSKQQTPVQVEADALAAVADLFLVPPDERSLPDVRQEELKQAWREYIDTPGEDKPK